MASNNVVLSAGVRSNLLSLQSTASEAESIQFRLSTGKKVNSALDNPVNFFTAAGLNNRAGDLNGLLDFVGNAIQTIKAADNGIKAISSLVKSAESIVRQAQSTTDTTQLAALVTQYNEIRSQIDDLAGDASFNGVNLIADDTTTLTVNFNEDSSSSLDIGSADLTTTGLGISAATDFSDADNLTDALDELKDASDTLRLQGSTFGSNLSIVQTRQTFIKDVVNTLKTGADSLTNADLNEESANLLALQTRQQLGQTALSLANQSQQGVLRLF